AEFPRLPWSQRRAYRSTPGSYDPAFGPTAWDRPPAAAVRFASAAVGAVAGRSAGLDASGPAASVPTAFPLVPHIPPSVSPPLAATADPSVSAASPVDRVGCGSPGPAALCVSSVRAAAVTAPPRGAASPAASAAAMSAVAPSSVDRRAPAAGGPTAEASAGA